MVLNRVFKDKQATDLVSVAVRESSILITDLYGLASEILDFKIDDNTECVLTTIDRDTYTVIANYKTRVILLILPDSTEYIFKNCEMGITSAEFKNSYNDLTENDLTLLGEQ